MESCPTFTGLTCITNLTRSPYIQLLRLTAIHRSVFESTMAALVHVFVCSRIEYSNSLHIGSTKDPTLPHPVSSRLCWNIYCSPSWILLHLLVYGQSISLASTLSSHSV